MQANAVLEEEFSLSEHAEARMHQRGITARMVRIALAIGEREWSHDAVCYRLTDRSLRGSLFARESDHLRGLCVVVADDGTVVTVKWDYRLRRPGPLRRSNREHWREVHARASQHPRDYALAA